MKINVVLDNAKIYAVDKIDVRLGEVFRVELEDQVSRVDWFSNNDPVLRIEVSEDGMSAVVQTQTIGKTTVQFQQNGNVIRFIAIEIFDRTAVSLNLSFGQPEVK